MQACESPWTVARRSSPALFICTMYALFVGMGVGLLGGQGVWVWDRSLTSAHRQADVLCQKDCYTANESCTSLDIYPLHRNIPSTFTFSLYYLDYAPTTRPTMSLPCRPTMRSGQTVIAWLAIEAVRAKASSLQSRETNATFNNLIQSGADAARNAVQMIADGIDPDANDPHRVPTSLHDFTVMLSGDFLGGLLTLFLGGAFAVQAWHYFERFGVCGSKRPCLQCAIWIVLFFSLLQDLAVVHWLWNIHVVHFGDFAFPLLSGGCVAHAEMMQLARRLF